MKMKQMKHWVICVSASATLLSNTDKYPSRRTILNFHLTMTELLT